MKVTNTLPKHYIEHDYFEKMLAGFDRNVFANKHVYITYDLKNISVSGKNVVVIGTAGDERGNPPLYANKVGVVFKHHLEKNNVGNTYHIPLPYVGGFSGNNSIPINNRKYDVSFIGRSIRNRVQAIEAMKKLKASTKLNFYFELTDTWCGGLPVGEYSKLMSDTKIAISPMGAVRCECLRFSEAVKCGCAIIACKHPMVRVFENCPAMYLDDWGNLESTISKIIPKLESINSNMVKCYDKYFSPEGVADYINHITSNVLNKGKK